MVDVKNTIRLLLTRGKIPRPITATVPAGSNPLTSNKLALNTVLKIKALH